MPAHTDISRKEHQDTVSCAASQPLSFCCNKNKNISPATALCIPAQPHCTAECTANEQPHLHVEVVRAQRRVVVVVAFRGLPWSLWFELDEPVTAGCASDRRTGRAGHAHTLNAHVPKIAAGGRRRRGRVGEQQSVAVPVGRVVKDGADAGVPWVRVNTAAVDPHRRVLRRGCGHLHLLEQELFVVHRFALGPDCLANTKNVAHAPPLRPRHMSSQRPREREEELAAWANGKNMCLNSTEEGERGSISQEIAAD